MLGLSLLPARPCGQQEAYLPVDERTGSFSDQDKPIQGQKKDLSSQAQSGLSQPYLGNGYDQDQDRCLGLVLSGHRPGLVH